MNEARLSDHADAQLEAIYDYTVGRWGEDQAEKYTRGIIEKCQKIAQKRVTSRPISAELGVDGYVAVHEDHFIYWRKRRGR